MYLYGNFCVQSSDSLVRFRNCNELDLCDDNNKSVNVFISFM